MDFAELNDLAVDRFTDQSYLQEIKKSFSSDSQKIIHQAKYDYLNSLSSIGGTFLKTIPFVGTFAVIADKSRDVHCHKNNDSWGGDSSLIHERINQRFSQFVDQMSSVMQEVTNSFNLKVRTMTMAIEDRDTTIQNLTIELEQLREMLQQENEVVTATLQAHPPIQQILQDYQQNPRIPLSTDQQVIIRLLAEIKRLNNDLRLAISIAL